MNESRGTRGPALRRSIGAKLAVIFLALAIIPMSITAYYSLTYSQDQVAEVGRDNMMRLSNAVSMPAQKSWTRLRARSRRQECQWCGSCLKGRWPRPYSGLPTSASVISSSWVPAA